MRSKLANINGLFGRVATILEHARNSVVRSVNTHMVLAYWQIGREIVESLQGGDDRAEYGRAVIDRLSERLTARYGRGFSTTNLRYFRNFHQVYAGRTPEIRHIESGESGDRKIRHIGGGESRPRGIRHTARGVLKDLTRAVEEQENGRAFSPMLGWAHYRLLMTIEHPVERLFYVRLFDDQFTTKGDGPTIGLVLCAQKNQTVARYSVLHGSKQVFAAKYVKHLPSEAQLKREIEREQRLLTSPKPEKKR